MSNLLKTGFPDAEFQRRIEKVVSYIDRENLDAYIVMEPYNLFYLGMYYNPGKRPLAFFIHKSGRVEAFVPDMEYYAASQLKYLYKVFPYDDNYDKKADMFSFMDNQVKADFGTIKRIQVDAVSLEQFSSADAAMKLSAVDRCVEVLSDSMAKLPVYVMDRSSREKVDHPLF